MAKKIHIEKEFQRRQNEHIWSMGKLYERYPISEWADMFPGLVHINQRTNCCISYYNQWGIDSFQKTPEQSHTMGSMFVEEHLHKETRDRLIKTRTEDFEKFGVGFISSSFQYFRKSWDKPYKWYLSSSTFIDEDHVLSFTQLLAGMDNAFRKVELLLEDQLITRNGIESFKKLTAREREVLKCITNGLTSQQIADQLFISIETVKTHRKNIKEKLKTRTLADMIRIGEIF